MMLKHFIKILILLVLCSGYFSSSQAQNLQRMDITQVSAPAQGVAVFMDYPDKAAIIIESPITTLRFSSNMNGIVEEMHEPEQGRYVLIIEPFTQILVIDSPGYIQQRQRIGNPQPRDVLYFDVKPEERASDFISVIFNVEPSDAQLFVNGQETPINQTTQLVPGSVEVRLEREGYRTITDAVEVNDQNIQFNYSLEEIDIVPVEIRSNVEGASVTIDGTVRGQIDRSGGLGLFLFPSTYALSVSQTGYVTHNLTLEVSEEGRNETRAELERNIGELSLQVAPSDARIYIDREDYSGQELIELAPGRYRLDVELQGYEPYGESIEISLSERTDVQVELERNVGELSLQVQPSNARVSLNRQDYSGQSLIELAPGRYRLDVELEGYEPYNETIEISRNDRTRREISLQPHLGSLQFRVSPSNARVQIINRSGQIVNEWTGIQLLRDIQVGTYTLRASADEHIDRERQIQIIRNETLQFSIELEEGIEVVEVTNPATGLTWMDRNLGAFRAAESSTDSEAYGDLYQWGRAADGHQVRTSRTTSTLSSSDSLSHASFILAPNSPYDWRSPQNNNLWQGVNGVNNSCPDGYRIPTEAEWEAERQSWSSNNSNGAFASPLKLPVAGRRYYSSGSIYNVGSVGYYWSSSVSGTSSRSLGFGSGNASMSSYSRAFGFSVRCLKN